LLLEATVKVMDEHFISQDAYRAIAALYPDLEREYSVSHTRVEITQSINYIVPIKAFDIANFDNNLEDSTNSEDEEQQALHEQSGNLQDQFIESDLCKGAYRSLIDMLRVLVPQWYEEGVLKDGMDIKLKFEGDGRNVGTKVKHVIFAICCLNETDEMESSTHYKPSYHYTLALYLGKESYQSLEIAISKFLPELFELKQNGFLEEGTNTQWSVKLYFSSDWKFITTVMGFNSANANHFCMYCHCTKVEIGDYQKVWNISKDISALTTYAGQLRPPLFGDLFDLQNIIPDELHLFLRISDVLLNCIVDAYWTYDALLFETDGQHAFAKEAQVCGVKLEFWKSARACNLISTTCPYTYTSLRGDDKKKLFQQLNLNAALPQALYPNRVRILWNSFLWLHNTMVQPSLSDLEISVFKAWQFLKFCPYLLLQNNFYLTFNINILLCRTMHSDF
jgi:hypothetical protein